MSALSHDVAAMLANFAAGDEAGFFAVAKDIATREQKAGHRNAAQEILEAIDAAREQRNNGGQRGQGAAADEESPEEEIVVDSDLTEFIQVSYPKSSLDELIIAPDLIERVRHLLEEHHHADELRDLGFTPAHRLLMEGPAGTGKTATANVIASELGLPLVTVWLDNLLSTYTTEDAVPSLREVFDRLARRRAVYLFDVFDTVSDYGSQGSSTVRWIFKAFLMFLDGLGKGSIAIAATNRREALDRSMFRHFDTVLSYSLPDETEAIKVLRAELGDRAPEAVLNEQDLYGQYLEGLSHAELTLAAQSAAKAAILRKEAAVTQDDLIYSLTNRGAHLLNSDGFD